jgi:hypothetical protein
MDDAEGWSALLAAAFQLGNSASQAQPALDDVFESCQAAAAMFKQHPRHP